MSATQISFADFALSQCPWCGATGPDFDESPAPADYCDHSTLCTSPAIDTAVAVVAHPLAVGGGECIDFRGPFLPVRGAPYFDIRPDYGWLIDPEWACGGLDACSYHPSGGHSSLQVGTYVLADGYSSLSMRF